MSRPLAIWVASIATAAVVYSELDQRYDGWTLSENLRPWAKEHPALFTVGCVAVPTWFYRHILVKAVEGSLSSS
jgi:hypothetical protein